MKNLLLTVGIVMIAAALISLLLAVLHLIGYHNVLDGSAELYDRLHGRMICFFAVGGVLAVIGAVCLIVRCRM